MTGGTAGAQTILTLPRVQQWQIAGESSRQTGSVSLTNTNTPTQSHTHIRWFPLVILLRFVTEMSNNLQGTTVLPVLMRMLHVFTRASCLQMHLHTSEHAFQTKEHTHSWAERHTLAHTHAQS